MIKIKDEVLDFLLVIPFEYVYDGEDSPPVGFYTEREGPFGPFIIATLLNSNVPYPCGEDCCGIKAFATRTYSGDHRDAFLAAL